MYRWPSLGLCMSSRNKRTHGDCIWYTVGATVLMALVKHVVEGIVIVVVDLFLCDDGVASGGYLRGLPPPYPSFSV